MHEIAKHEFVTWLGLSDFTKLTEYEKTFLNIDVNNALNPLMSESVPNSVFVLEKANSARSIRTPFQKSM